VIKKNIYKYNLNKKYMPDIEMCLNKDCTIRNNCYRFTAIPSEYQQAYSNFQQDEEGKCEHHQLKPY